MPTTTTALPRLITTEELATMLGLKPVSVRKRCQDNTWPFVRFGRAYRFTQAQVDEIIANATVRATSDDLAPVGRS